MADPPARTEGVEHYARPVRLAGQIEPVTGSLVEGFMEPGVTRFHLLHVITAVASVLALLATWAWVPIPAPAAPLVDEHPVLVPGPRVDPAWLPEPEERSHRAQQVFRIVGIAKSPIAGATVEFCRIDATGDIKQLVGDTGTGLNGISDDNGTVTLPVPSPPMAGLCVIVTPPPGLRLTRATIPYPQSPRLLQVVLRLTGTLELSWQPASPLKAPLSLPLRVRVRVPTGDGTQSMYRIEPGPTVPDDYARNWLLDGAGTFAWPNETYFSCTVPLGQPGDITRVHGLPCGPVVVEGCPSGMRKMVPVESAITEQVTRLTVSLDPGQTVTGIVRDANGSPLRGLPLVVEWDSRGWRGYAGITTDDAGRYALSGLPDVIVTLSVPGTSIRSELNLPLGGDFLPIRLPADTAIVSGRVTNPDRTRPLRVEVALQDDPTHSPRCRVATETTRDGEFTLIAEAPGEEAWLLIFAGVLPPIGAGSHGPGYPVIEDHWIPVPQAVTPRRAVTTRADLHLVRPVRVSGTIRTADGTVLSTGRIRRVRSHYPSSCLQSGVSAGHFELLLQPGWHHLEVRGSGCEGRCVVEVEIPEASEHALDLVVGKGDADTADERNR